MVFILIVSFSSSLLIVKLIPQTTNMKLTCPHQCHELCGITFFLQHPLSLWVLSCIKLYFRFYILHKIFVDLCIQVAIIYIPTTSKENSQQQKNCAFTWKMNRQEVTINTWVLRLNNCYCCATQLTSQSLRFLFL